MVSPYKGNSIKKFNIDTPKINIEGLFDKYQKEDLSEYKYAEMSNNSVEVSLDEFLIDDDLSLTVNNLELLEEELQDFDMEIFKSSGATLIFGLVGLIAYSVFKVKEIEKENIIKNTKSTPVNNVKSVLGEYVLTDKLNDEKIMIPIDKLNSILKDENLYKSYRFFEKNQDKFEGYTQSEIANAMKLYLERAKKNNVDLGLTQKQIERMNSIIEWYSVDKEELDNLLTNYKNYYEPKMWTNEGANLIYDDSYQIAMESRMEELLAFIEDSEYKKAIEDMRNYCLTIEYSIIKNFVDVGEEKFNIIANNILSRDYIVSPEDDFAYLNKFINEYRYTLNEELNEKYKQLLKIKELNEWENEIVDRFYNFAGTYVSKEKVDTVYGSFIYKTNVLFQKENTSIGNAAAYNDGTNSTINLKYDPYIIKSYMTHESLHQISHGYDGYNEVKEYISNKGISYSVYDFTAKEWKSTGQGLNESITEYFTELIMADAYPDKNSGYEEAVEKLKILMDKEIFNLDELKQAYFTNDRTILTNKLDEIGLKINMPELSDELFSSFDKAISGNYELRNEGLQEINKIIKKLSIYKIFEDFY